MKTKFDPENAKNIFNNNSILPIVNKYLENKINPLISFIGGGGKTSSLLNLSVFLSKEGKNAIICTTTKMYAIQYDFVNQTVIRETVPLSEELSEGIVFIGHHLERSDKLVGHASEDIDKLHEYAKNHWVLVEADGSRGKSVKAHEAFEPVLPHTTDLVVAIIGADAYGKPRNEEYIHRLEIFNNVVKSSNDIITELDFADLINEESGYFWNTPSEAKKIVLVNKVKDSDFEWVERLRSMSRVPLEVVKWNAL